MAEPTRSNIVFQDFSTLNMFRNEPEFRYPHRLTWGVMINNDSGIILPRLSFSIQQKDKKSATNMAITFSLSDLELFINTIRLTIQDRDRNPQTVKYLPEKFVNGKRVENERVHKLSIKMGYGTNGLFYLAPKLPEEPGFTHLFYINLGQNLEWDGISDVQKEAHYKLMAISYFNRVSFVINDWFAKNTDPLKRGNNYLQEKSKDGDKRVDDLKPAQFSSEDTYTPNAWDDY